MNKDTFVNAIHTAVEDSAVTGTISLLSRPPGRRPPTRVVELSEWYNALSFNDRQNVEHVIQEAAHFATFNFLCVLDGVRVIEDRAEKGSLELHYRRGTIDVHLNDVSGDMLHDLFNTP